jgi:hypothetical protein
VSFVYESPDKGQTVYRRKVGEVVRELIKDTRTVDGRPLHEHIQENKMWGEIRRMAKTNPALHDALERAIVIYQLSKKNDRPT